MISCTVMWLMFSHVSKVIMNLNTPCRGHLPQHEVAGPLYLRARKWLAASQCFEEVDNFGRALKVLDEQEMYDQAMDCLQRYKIRKQVRLYHWWELPQVSFLLQQKSCHDSHVGFFVVFSAYDFFFFFFFKYPIFYIFFFSFFIVGLLFRNIHPSLQYFSRSCIHTSLYDFCSSHVHSAL